jgi:hypothetical protein
VVEKLAGETETRLDPATADAGGVAREPVGRGGTGTGAKGGAAAVGGSEEPARASEDV